MAGHVELWNPSQNGADDDRDLDMLAEVLHATVHAGASVSFVLPFSMEEARAFWQRKVLPQIGDCGSRLLVFRDAGRIVGTVQLELPWPPNQRHRGEVKKLLVHPDLRRRGIARALMLALEEVARCEGRSLLTLDTRAGDHAEPLYRSLGYLSAGTIPRYARAPRSQELEPTTFMYKELASAL
ncbi:MAG TPA: GNAT family N-acetyltransferase [Bryobacteraceae bacterium]|nr:GNAT family N-acetyltransferase [Bryobacteraceae bacterium]